MLKEKNPIAIFITWNNAGSRSGGREGGRKRVRRAGGGGEGKEGEEQRCVRAALVVGATRASVRCGVAGERSRSSCSPSWLS